MKSLILSLLMSSAFNLSIVSGFFHFTPVSHTFGQLLKDISNFIKCAALDLIHPLFSREDPLINYWLYTKENPEGCDLQPTARALKRCKFNPKRETKVLVHGWVGVFPKSKKNLNFMLKDLFLKAGNFNVVIHNYTAYNDRKSIYFIGYPLSSVRSILVGVKMSSWIWFLQSHTGVSPKSFHILGHSLGAEVAAIAGKTTCLLGRVTYLDPAAPVFRFFSLLKPAYTDAIYTEAIHTDAANWVFQGYGYVQPVAHIDFYPNGGKNQPKCYKGATFLYMEAVNGTVHDHDTRVSCNHYAAAMYYIASFKKGCHFYGLICAKYEDYLTGKCNKNNSQKCEMGYSKINPNLQVHSKCYFRTSKHYPFCLGNKPHI